ncbi:MAG: Gfo/Idh/MocA family oxidoreductase [Planctomycetota bacterium]
MTHSMNRRSFLKTTAATAATAAGAGVLSGRASAQPLRSANGKLNIALVGAGNIAGHAMWGAVDDNIVALADVDETMFLQKADKFPQLNDARKFADFRVMLDEMEDEIDAVCINTPDHTHFVATIAAMERGMHVCTQKPLTHNVWEALTLKRAKDRYGVVTNMANQGHTHDGIREMREWYEADVFGQITEVHSYFGGPGWKIYDGNPENNHFFMRTEAMPPAAEPIPSHFNWDLWKGPVVTDLPYNGAYHPLGWRGHYAFGNGLVGDWIPHTADAPVWILDLYDPVAVELEEVDGGDEWTVPNSNRIRWDFERRGDKAPCTFYWYNGRQAFRPEKPEGWDWGDDIPGSGTFYIGEKQVGYTDNRSNKPRLASKEATRALKESGAIEPKYPRIKGGPHKEWVRAIKGEGPEPGSNFDVSAPFTAMSLLGAIVMRHGGKIEWDAENARIINRPEFNAWVKPEVRPGWEYGEDLWSA